MDTALPAQRIEDRVAAWSGRNPACESLCALVAGLLLITETAPPPSKVAAPSGPAGSDAPLWDLACLELDWPAAWDLLDRLAASLQEHPKGPAAARSLARLRQESAPGPGPLRAALLDDRPSLQAVAADLGLELDLLRLLLRLALRPNLLALARAAQPEGLPAGSPGRCPMCGSPPALAELSSQDGQRRLHCGLCETAWEFPRLKCPFCRENRQDRVVMLMAQDEEGLSVQACRSCGGYIKTLDLRAISGPIIPPLDDAATWHLDLLAHQRLAADPPA